MFTSQWRKPSLLVLMSLMGSSALAAHADVVRIVSVNGTYDPNHVATVSVQPGDMVTLSADLLDPNNNYTAEGQPVEDFNWFADDSQSDQCLGSAAADCLNASDFEMTDYGVNFYVPYTMGQQITLTVSSSLGAATDADGSSLTDSIVLINSTYGQDLPPVQVITSPDQYPASTFDPNIAVNGQGRWIVIDGVRYWTPYTYVVDQNDEWTPYQNGYWNWSEGYGYTWVSYDPWGWATDHYGVWRHHGVYGWMWLPFDDHHYEPNCVTFFDNGNDHIGWYPYFDSWADGYRHGDQQGFDDGFWLGNASVRGYGDRDAAYNYHQGFTDVPYGHFRETNIYSFRDRTDADVRGLVSANRFGHNPGMYADAQRDESLTYVQTRAGGVIEITQTTTVRSRGGAEILRPIELHQAPTVYAGISRGDNLKRPVAVGTVYGAGQLGNRPIAPSTNGRGISAPPRATDPHSGAVNVLPPRARNPMQPTRTNPIVGSRPVSAPVRAPVPVKVPSPVFHPPVQQQPVRQQPPVQQPVRQQPPVQQPVRQQPPVQQPVRQQPPVQQPVRQQPPVQQPVRQQPPVQQPVRQQPPVQQPVRQQPPVQQPVRQQPPVQQPVRQQPVRQQQPRPQQPTPQQPRPQGPGKR